MGINTATSAGRAVIRIGRDADLDFVVSLSKTAFSRYSHRPGVLARRLLAEGHTVIAEHVLAGRSVPLGFAAVDVYRGASSTLLAHLSAIAVVPDALGCGVGHELLQAAEEFGRAKGAVAMSLLTAETNTAAQRLFERSGYQRILPVADAYKNEQDAIRMLKSLSLART